MKILIIHQYFLGKDEAGGSRFNQFAKYWSRNGHKITVIAGTVHYATGLKKENYRKKWVIEENDGEAKVLRTYVHSGYNKNFMERLLAYFSFTVSSTWAGIFYTGKQDVILATSPPLFVGISGYIISRVKRIPFIFEVRDLWPKFAIDTGVLRNKLFIKLAYRLERFIYEKSLLINVLTPAYKKYLIEEREIPERKIIFIPNGADLSLFQPAIRDNWVRKRYNWQNKFVILYVGAHGVANDLIQLIKVAERFRDHPDILFALIGDGMEKQKLEKLVVEKGLTNVQFIDSRPKREMLDFINATDACTAVLKKVFITTYPNKLFDYMACAKPVILPIDGSSRELIEDANAGIYVEPENPIEFEEAVLRLYNNHNLCKEYGENGYRYVKVKFSREKVAYKYEKILQRVIKE